MKNYNQFTLESTLGQFGPALGRFDSSVFKIVCDATVSNLPNEHSSYESSSSTNRSFINNKDYIVGISEFDLIKRLQSSPNNFFDKNALSTPLTLFQTHFIVFNSLYRLKKEGESIGKFTINIEALNISIQFIQSTTCHTSHQVSSNSANVSMINTATIENNKCRDQKLSDYYLDWNNFKDTNSEDVEQLLILFWQQFQQRSTIKNVAGTADLSAALLKFGYKQIPTTNDLKMAYKKRTTQVHPDKGGSVKEFQELFAAYQVIKLATEN